MRVHQRKSKKYATSHLYFIIAERRQQSCNSMKEGEVLKNRLGEMGGRAGLLMSLASRPLDIGSDENWRGSDTLSSSLQQQGK